MIFVTVGTHEQQFNRLIEYVDKNIYEEEVFMQIGYSTYTPVNHKYKKMITYEEMSEYIEKARIIITHGGPGTIFQIIQKNKIPIVVPRMKLYGEHVNDHQVDFTKRMFAEGIIFPIFDIDDLKDQILRYEELVEGKMLAYNSNNDKFVDRLEEEIDNLFKGKKK